jgi:glycosyltransferase involved in cell wall biosynthesis
VLPAYCELESPRGAWKLVIVDNGSTDQTKHVVSSFQRCLALTYLFEPTPGKNAALNLGLNHIEGDLVVFSDDDALPHKDWLVQMRAAADAHPAFTVFAGSVKPRWLKPAPDWVLNWVPMGPTFTVSDPRLSEGLVQPCHVFGPNMAIRSQVFGNHCFCESIGPSGKNYPMGSETEFVQRLVRSGFRCWYSPKSVVEHLVDEAHLNKSWILRRAVLYGRGRYRLESLRGTAKHPEWFGVPRYLFRQLLKHAIEMMFFAMLRDPRRMFLAQWELHCCWGQALEARKICVQK